MAAWVADSVDNTQTNGMVVTSYLYPKTLRGMSRPCSLSTCATAKSEPVPERTAISSPSRKPSGSPTPKPACRRTRQSFPITNVRKWRTDSTSGLRRLSNFFVVRNRQRFLSRKMAHAHAPKSIKISAAAQPLAQVAHERANVGSLATLHIDVQIRIIVCEQCNGVDGDRARPRLSACPCRASAYARRPVTFAAE